MLNTRSQTEEHTEGHNIRQIYARNSNINIYNKLSNTYVTTQPNN